MKEDDEANNESPELSAVVGALLDILNDKDTTVQLSVNESIKKLAQRKPLVVIHAAVYFWELHRKMSKSHSIAVLKIMTDICQRLDSPLDKTLATSIADLALVELENQTNEEASDLLVALSKSQCSEAMGALIIKFKPNQAPHHLIIRTIGMIAGKHPTKILPFIKVTLNVLEPLLPDMSEEQLRLASTFTLGKLADAINDCLTNTEILDNTALNKDIFYQELSSAFDVLTYNWLRTCRCMALTESILISLASMSPLLPKVYDEKLILKVVPLLLNFCKKFNVRLAASRVLALILNAATEDVKELLRPNLEQIHHTLSEIISVAAPFDATRDALLAHYEVLQCFRAIVVLFPEEGLDRILAQLRSQNVSQRSRALVVLRHLINTLPAEDEASLQRIALTLQESLGDGSTRHVVGAIVALAARPSFPLLPSQRSNFIKFLVLHCSLGTYEGEACEEALHLLSSTVEGAETWLWPSLIKALLDKTYASSVVPILRALAPLAVKIIRDENNFAAQKDFQSLKVFGRCLELLENEDNRPAVIVFLRCTAPLLGHQLKPQWDTKLLELSRFLDQSSDSVSRSERTLIWEERIVEFLEESVSLEGDDWGLKLAGELFGKSVSPSLSIILAAVARNAEHVTVLVDLARTHSVVSTGQSPISSKYARAVGICAKNHLDMVLKIMEEFCSVEDAKKQPVKLLGLVKDTKAAASNEAAKAGLLRAYAEIAKKGNAMALFPALDKSILPWIIRQLNDCKEITTKEAGLAALEQGGGAIHPNRLANSTGFRARGNALATLLKLYQLSSGYRPLQLYPMILRAILSLIRIPPQLTNEEKEVLLETTTDKVISAGLQIEEMKMPQVMQQTIECLGAICTETVSDSADTLALLVDFLVPWMQSRSSAHRRTTLLVLRTTLRSYYDSLKYTYPAGKLEPGKLLGRILCWSADPDLALRPLVVDCIALALNIAARYRSTVPDNNLNQDLNESKRIIVSEDTTLLYDGVKTLASAACERVATGEIVSLVNGLVEGLLYRGEGGVAAGIGLTELFRLRGFDIPRSNLHVVVTIVEQMRLIENASCRRGAAAAIKALSRHHPVDTVDHLLHQPLPLDNGTKECWRELGKSDDVGLHSLELLLTRLGNNNVLVDDGSSSDSDGKRSTAAFTSLAAVVAIGQLLSSLKAEDLIERELAVLIAVLLKYLAGWLHVDPPMSIISTKFGFVPNRETCKIVPHKEVYAVLTKVLHIIEAQEIFESESETEESLVGTVHLVVQCLSKLNDVLIEVADYLEKLTSSSLPAQRAVAIAFLAELVGKLNTDVTWLDSTINILHQAKADSSALVRKLATIGLTRVALLPPNKVEAYLDGCLSSLMNGLEEPANAEGSTEVVLESLKGLAVLLSSKTKKPISPRVIFALKPFVEKENWEMRLAAIKALEATAQGWQRFVESPDDDVTDHLLGCIPCLVIKLEDGKEAVATASRKVLFRMAHLMQCDSLAKVITAYLGPESKLSIESFLRELISCLKADLPVRAEELRNATVRGYSKSENPVTRASSALILGLFGEPRPEDVQRMLQLLHDQENFVRARAARALALCFTL